MKTYIKNNGMSRVYLIGVHPYKDFVAISSCKLNDIAAANRAWSLYTGLEEALNYIDDLREQIIELKNGPIQIQSIGDDYDPYYEASKKRGW